MNTQTLINSPSIPPVPVNVGSVPGHNMQKPKLTDQQKEAVAKAMASIGDQLSAIVDDELNSIIVQIDVDKKNAQAGPFRLIAWFREHIKPEQFALFPKPGTKAEDGVTQPDIYEEPYFRDGNKKFRKTSFYLKFFLSHMPEGKRIAATLQHIALAKDEKANHAVVPADIMKLNPVDLENLREDLVSQQNNGVQALRSAVGLMIQFTKVNALAECKAAPLMDGEGKVRKVAKPIKVWNLKEPENEWNLYSIAGFMQFDPDKAGEQGGTFAALKLTAKREQGEDDPDLEGEKPVAINTAATFVARVSDVHEFIVNKLRNDPKKELQAEFLKNHIFSAGSDDLIESLDDIASWCRHILSIPAVAARLEAISQRPAA